MKLSSARLCPHSQPLMGAWVDFDAASAWWPATYHAGRWAAKKANEYRQPLARRGDRRGGSGQTRSQVRSQLAFGERWAPALRSRSRQAPSSGQWNSGQTASSGHANWVQEPPDPLFKAISKARAVASRRAHVLENAKARLQETRDLLASLQARVEAEEADLSARAAAAQNSETELASLEQQLADRDGDEAMPTELAATHEPPDDRYTRLASSANPDVIWLIGMARRGERLPPTPTQVDRNEDIVDMAVDDRDADELRKRLNEADELEGDEKDNLRRLALDTFIRHYPTKAPA